eukprot:CAMPEP_0181220086 /NCGR_PEP_ID=MMETSP1096-20121128/28644_1 /TAXON_ID=156174 ORGANISM="Chrysochromulina ericina, Strain CCMP281" /NCGR_SAMPLE_ID=MMETSP1096 /ASSEMBLY_ACC=CAM_ASM_000453 /LENGTH=185 /DNA_ID=CAMNT_0023312555 /DNA_START=214 /DNA_END=768 /DNA_ORIENTATION=-
MGADQRCDDRLLGCRITCFLQDHMLSTAMGNVRRRKDVARSGLVACMRPEAQRTVVARLGVQQHPMSSVHYQLFSGGGGSSSGGGRPQATDVLESVARDQTRHCCVAAETVETLQVIVRAGQAVDLRRLPAPGVVFSRVARPDCDSPVSVAGHVAPRSSASSDSATPFVYCIHHLGVCTNILSYT